MFQFNVNYVTSITKKIFSGQKTENFRKSDVVRIGPWSSDKADDKQSKGILLYVIIDNPLTCRLGWYTEFLLKVSTNFSTIIARKWY